MHLFPSMSKALTKDGHDQLLEEQTTSLSFCKAGFFVVKGPASEADVAPKQKVRVRKRGAKKIFS